MEGFAHGTAPGPNATGSSVYATALSHGTGEIPSGSYFVHWYFETETATGERVEVRVRADGAVVGEGAHLGCARPVPAAGFAVVELGGASSHALEIAWRDPDGGDAAEIRNARIALWKLP